MPRTQKEDGSREAMRLGRWQAVESVKTEKNLP